MQVKNTQVKPKNLATPDKKISSPSQRLIKRRKKSCYLLKLISNLEEIKKSKEDWRIFFGSGRRGFFGLGK